MRPLRDAKPAHHERRRPRESVGPQGGCARPLQWQTISRTAETDVCDALVLKDTLQARGSLDQIRARVRSEIFAALDDQVGVPICPTVRRYTKTHRPSCEAEQTVPKPKLSNENLIINELIREYLEYNGYRHALSVFLPGGSAWRNKRSRVLLRSYLSIT